MSTLAQFNDALENAPAFPSTPMAKDLAGWRLADGHHVCVTCTARVVERGCGHVLRGADPVWLPETVTCEATLHTSTGEPRE